VPVVGKHFPDCIEDGAINRRLLANRVVGNAEAIALLESLVHPLVSEAREHFYERSRQRGDFMVVFDVPLLL
jgi:dephospho-CoA kinase